MELEAWKIEKTNMSRKEYEIPITDIDYRNVIYERLMNEIPDLKDSDII